MAPSTPSSTTTTTTTTITSPPEPPPTTTTRLQPNVVVGRFTTPYDCFAESWRWTYQPENEIVEIGQPD